MKVKTKSHRDLNICNLTIERRFCLFVTPIALMTLLFGCERREAQPDHSSSQPLSEFRELIAARPTPDLTQLAERSAPNYTAGHAIESFYDILKLRDVGKADAVPVLEKILSDHAGSTRIHGFAAGQALFCIGTAEAHKILAEYLLTSQCNARLGIHYTSHWQMHEPKRSRFIKRYHLKNLSKDLALKLKAKTQPDKNGRRIDFTLVLRNISDRPFRIRDRQVYLGKMLYFQSQDERFVRSGNTYVEYEMPMPKWLQLVPGASHEYNIAVRIRDVHKLKRRYRLLSEDANLVADTFDVMFDIKKPGRFNVYAMFEDQPLTRAQLGQLEFDNPWSGRVVSEPVTVEILEKRSQNFPKQQVHGLVTLMRRSAVSIPSNPAESFAGDHSEYRQFLHMSLGSCTELETQIAIAKELNYTREKKEALLLKKLDHICRMTSNVLKKLQQNT